VLQAVESAGKLSRELHISNTIHNKVGEAWYRQRLQTYSIYKCLFQNYVTGTQGTFPPQKIIIFFSNKTVIIFVCLFCFLL